jgi:phytol kinase
VLSIFCFSGYTAPYVGALGILVMGYGDGMAAIIGKTFGKTSYTIGKSTKTIEGSLTMFIISSVVILIILTIYNPGARYTAIPLLAISATIIEAITPKGLDNITVPLGISFLYYWFFLVA